MLIDLRPIYILFFPHYKTPRYSWNIANVDIKHQSINQSYYRNHMWICLDDSVAFTVWYVCMNKKNPFSKLKIAIVLKLDTNLDIHHVIHVLNIFVLIKKNNMKKDRLKPLLFRIKLNCIAFSSYSFTIESHVYHAPCYWDKNNIFIFNNIVCFFSTF
jgi:hypothetical protein